jgi:DNA-directed RNA polymerase specialized sigma24 family protein
VLQQRLNGLSNAEIAATLGLREDLVRKRLSRALKELKHRW